MEPVHEDEHVAGGGGRICGEFGNTKEAAVTKVTEKAGLPYEEAKEWVGRVWDCEHNFHNFSVSLLPGDIYFDTMNKIFRKNAKGNKRHGKKPHTVCQRRLEK